MTNDFTIADFDDGRIGVKVGLRSAEGTICLVLSADTPSRAGTCQREFEASFEPGTRPWRANDDATGEMTDDARARIRCPFAVSGGLTSKPSRSTGRTQVAG
jgi:hypothetical protein